MHRVVLPKMFAAARQACNKATEADKHQSHIVLHLGHDVTIVPLLFALESWTADDGWFARKK